MNGYVRYDLGIVKLVARWVCTSYTYSISVQNLNRFRKGSECYL